MIHVVLYGLNYAAVSATYIIVPAIMIIHHKCTQYIKRFHGAIYITDNEYHESHACEADELDTVHLT